LRIEDSLQLAAGSFNDLKDKRNIFSIFIEDPVFKTDKGIGVLSTFKDLKKKYPNGKEYVDDFRGQTV
jgi:hypothetical protein